MISDEINTQRRRYYTPEEVAEHNHETDCWVSIFNKVYDLTLLIAENEADSVRPIVHHAGQDITHWFHPHTQDVRTYIHPKSGLEAPYTPQGRFLHVPPATPRSDWRNDYGTPWWKDEKYVIGSLTSKTRKIRIINTLTQQEHMLEVPQEETLAEIRERYLAYNKHAGSYRWKRVGKILDMNKTLQENGIKDEQDTFVEHGMQDDFYVPAIHLHFIDDLTVA